jgi:hypothetical protein
MSNIKTKRFYKEAEDMQDGWGKYLRYIDTLKDKAQNNDRMVLNDFCWTLYGDGHCSATWGDFKEYAQKTGLYRHRYNKWLEIFDTWCVTYRLKN